MIALVEPSWDLTPRQLCDLELLLNGAFSPLRGFLGRADYDAVCAGMRLAGGTLWPMPVTLDVDPTLARSLRPGQRLALRDPEGVPLAVLRVEDVWEPDLRREAHDVFGTLSTVHPGVRHLLQHTRPFYVGGRLEGLQSPAHHDFQALRLTPGQLRAEFARLGWSRVVAFHTRNPMHRAHTELAARAAREVDAGLLLHPAVGMTKPGDVDHYTRVRCYQAVLPRLPQGTLLALLPLAMRMGGPREALWHAIIRRNHGCSHFIVGRDHAGPGADADGRPFYGPYEAQELALRHQQELGIAIVPFRQMVYLPDAGRYVAEDEVPPGARALSLSGTELARRLAEGREIPEWFAFPQVVAELRARHPPRGRQGFTVFFTGLSGAGKSTLANVLLAKLLERGGRPVSLLDGDVVRKHLSSELGFSRQDRDTNIRRIGFVASEITRSGGVALCAPIAPFDATRKEVRALIAPLGGFVLVHVSTPLAVCEQRDRKGLYARARAGAVPEFTGISSPYEPPDDAEVAVDTSGCTPEEAVGQILRHLERAGYLAGAGAQP
jgi:sulfate adenylyltransferase